MPAVPTGYAYGSPELEPSSVSRDDLRELEASVVWSDDDAAALQRAAEVLEDQTEDILDAWYGFLASQPHLVAYFADLGGQPIERYLVRGRFGQWILDTCTGPHDDRWLAYIRPFPAKKGDPVDVVERMYQAWRKAVILQITLLAQAYAKGEW